MDDNCDVTEIDSSNSTLLFQRDTKFSPDVEICKRSLYVSAKLKNEKILNQNLCLPSD